MRVVYSVIATLWLAMVTCRANENPPGRCCPSKFEVNPNPTPYHFRCEVANLTAGCDGVTMTENVPNTQINTQGRGAPCDDYISYVMTDPNWQDQEEFQPNVACAFYLPPVPECQWQLWLVKGLDPIVGSDSCRCDCEDSVQLEEVGGRTDSFCDSDPVGNDANRWCNDANGPDNVLGLQSGTTGTNTGALITFRSDNTNGIGRGGLVFAMTVPGNRKRSVRPPPLASRKQKAYCWEKFTLCSNSRCKIPCECYSTTQQQISCNLYDLFTDATGRTACQNYYSTVDVVRRASWLAADNIWRYRRPVPTYAQLQMQLQLPTRRPPNYTNPSLSYATRCAPRYTNPSTRYTNPSTSYTNPSTRYTNPSTRYMNPSTRYPNRRPTRRYGLTW